MRALEVVLILILTALSLVAPVFAQTEPVRFMEAENFLCPGIQIREDEFPDGVQFIKETCASFDLSTATNFSRVFMHQCFIKPQSIEMTKMGGTVNVTQTVMFSPVANSLVVTERKVLSEDAWGEDEFGFRYDIVLDATFLPSSDGPGFGSYFVQVHSANLTASLTHGYTQDKNGKWIPDTFFVASCA